LAVWENYESLFLFFKEASKSDDWSRAENATFSGMLTRLESPDFLLDLGLMYDVLFELSSLSLSLQDRDCTLLKAERCISFKLYVIDEFKTKPGSKLLQARIAKREGKFKSIELRTNSRHIAIEPASFLSSLRNNLELRLNSTAYTKKSTAALHKKNVDEYNLLVKSFSVLEIKEWPLPRVPSFGVEELTYLSERFGFESREAVNELRDHLNKAEKAITSTLFRLKNVLNLIPISSAECERGFSQMNLICTKIRNRLNIEHISSLLFIKLNGPSLSKFNPLPFVKLWLRDNHQSSNSSRNTNHPVDFNEKDDSDFFNDKYSYIFD
jgi:hypothetical protein